MFKIWRRIKMFNAKLTITNIMRKLRINVLVSILSFWGAPQLSASFSALAVRVSVTFLFTWGTSAHVATPWSNLFRVMVAVGMPSLLAFQGVHPVTRSISPQMIRVSCALNAGSADEPPHQICSYTLLFSLFPHFPYIADPPLRTSALTRPRSRLHDNRTRSIGPISLIWWTYDLRFTCIYFYS